MGCCKGKLIKGASHADALSAYMENDHGAEAMAVNGELSSPVIAAIRIFGEEIAIATCCEIVMQLKGFKRGVQPWIGITTQFWRKKQV